MVSFSKAAAAIVDSILRRIDPIGFNADGAKAAADFVMSSQANMPDYLGLGVRIATLVFDAWPYATRAKPFHRLGTAERVAQVAAWENSALGIHRKLILFYRSLAVFGYFSNFETELRREPVG